MIQYTIKIEKPRINFLATGWEKYRRLKMPARNNWSVLKPISKKDTMR
jgi:hypothetical protein